MLKEEFEKVFPCITEIKVAWGEMDALNHVNNAVYFRYFEIARLEYFNEVQLMESMHETNIGPVLGSTNAKYFLPVTYPDTLHIGTRVTNIADDRFDMEYQVFSSKLGKVVTKGEAQVVMFDFNTHQKATLSERLKREMSEMEAMSPC
ncbi:acyl-CoA thioesterase [Vibrio tapetis]|uniref:Thioesterase n=1 Tax=Vibrio tapetis subsp. tapetis TaxID=1671868 RepID=A0A2N8ZL62_9VIBR|nr:acyl-CoA thioesterase [Vibrio tapetis]SON52645.1 conserved protein of unknown function [Vibrio tapetis subsp. tapetis]